MSKRCASCDRIYPDHAVYCALCGKTLAAEDPATSAPASCCGSGGTRGLAVLVAAVLVGLTAVAVFQASGSTRESVYKGPIVKAEIELPDCKRECFYKMLAPKGVKVIVHRSDCCLQVSGSPREVEALSRFAELLVRFQNVPDGHIRARLTKMKNQLISQDYKLPRGQAQNLFDLLAHEDVSVWVSRSGRKVTVQALPKDQQTVAYVAKILVGKRLR